MRIGGSCMPSLKFDSVGGAEGEGILLSILNEHDTHNDRFNNDNIK